MRKFIATIFTTFLLGVAHASNDVIVTHSHGHTNWTTGEILATGVAAIPPQVPHPTQARVIALRRAKMDALRNLAESVSNVRVTSQSSVKNFLFESDVVRTEIDVVIQGAKVVNEEHTGDEVNVTVMLSQAGKISSILLPLAIDERKASARYDVGNNSSIASIFNYLNRPLAFVNTNYKFASLFNIAFAQQSGEMTGIIIDASHLREFELALAPKIRDENGRILYPTNDSHMAEMVKNRPVSYHFDLEEAVTSPRVAANPLILKAKSTYMYFESDLVISNSDAQRVRDSADLLGRMNNAAVIIIVGD